jgi:hypothetical protein
MRNWKRNAKFVAIIALTLTLSACLTDSGNEQSGPISVSITNPANATEIATPDIVVNLVGTTRSTTEINAVEWVNDRGGRGKASGKENWNTGNIVLMLGLNNITVTATDIDGNSSSKSIAVDREKTSPTAAANPESIVMYSYNSDLRHPAPVQGATIQPISVYFFLSPSDEWLDRGINEIEFQCCEGISGPGAGETHRPATSVGFEPWSLLLDLRDLQAGGSRRLEISAKFDDGSRSETKSFDFSVASNSSNSNSPPTISGTAPNSATVGMVWQFQPIAKDTDGDSLSFSIAEKPEWATFDKSTGLLRGAPRNSHVGIYRDIVVSVSDGQSTTSHRPFSIEVLPYAGGTATLTWAPPTKRVDQTPLPATSLAGYRIHYGQSPRNYSSQITVNNPNLSSYVIDNLASGTWYFAVAARDSSGQYSGWSNESQIMIP